MTRYLSTALGAQEPGFSQGIQQLERASGLPSEDIRLSAQNAQHMRIKIAALGLDPQDTTAEELYTALHERLREDEQAFRAALAIDKNADSLTVLRQVVKFALGTTAHAQTLALKTSVAKQMLRKKPPKMAMKKLGYRSLDSMLKHEPVMHIYAAAVIAEPATWHKVFREQYSKLRASDYEMRPLSLTIPTTRHWQKFGAEFAASAKHTTMTFKELGTVVVLPLAEHVEALAIMTALLSIHELNQIRVFSSYAKLQQVKPHFGRIVRAALFEEPQIIESLAGHHVTWQTIHRFYARHAETYDADMFEPNVQPEDLSWQEAEEELATVAPALAFWRGTQHLNFAENGQVVSCNMLDVALNYCNHLSFSQRIMQYMRQNLWQELLVRYLKQDSLSRAVQQHLSKQLLGEITLAE